MGRFGLWQAGQMLLGLFGAVLLAAAVGAYGHDGAGSFLSVVMARLVAMGHGDFGVSVLAGTPAWSQLAARLPTTLSLAGTGALVAFIIGGPLGLVLGAGRWLRAAAPLIQIVAALPVFCASLLLVWLAAIVFHWPHPPYTDASLLSALLHQDTKALSDILWAYALPALTVGAAGAAAVQLALRRAAAEAMDASYRKGLRLLGLPALEIDRLYLAPQILAGLLAHLGEIVLALLSATAIVEWVFDWPGAAVLFVKAVALHDWPVAALVLLVFAAIKLVADFAGAVGARALAGESAAP